MTLDIWLQLCQPVTSAATAATATAASMLEQQPPSSSHKVLLHHHQQQQVLFPTPKQSHRHQEDQHHRSSSLTGVERKSDHSEAHSSSLTPVHAADYNELRGKYGYFPPSMFRDFMHDARARTFNTLYGSIDSNGMFHPANHLAHKQSSSSSSSLPMGSAPGPGSQSHHNPFYSTGGSPAESLSQGSSHSPPSQYFDGSHKMTESGTYTPSYHTASSGGESALGSRERKNRQIEIGETLSSASNRQGEGNQRSLGLLSHLMHHHPHGFIPPHMMMMPPPPMHHFGHEMMPFMPPFHAPFHSMLPLHQLDHMYSYGRPFLPYMSPMMGYDAFGMMQPPAYPGMGIGYPGMYHRSNGDGIDAVSPASSGSHASKIHLSGGIYPPSRHPHHPRHPADPSHMHARYQPSHLSPHHQHQVPAQPFPLPSHSPPPRTLFPYSFQPTPSSAPESRPDLASSSSSHKHDKHAAWIDEDEGRGGSSPILPSRPRSASQVREEYEKAMIHNASKLTASPFFPPYKRREDQESES